MASSPSPSRAAAARWQPAQREWQYGADPPADGHPGAGAESGGGGQVTLQAGSSVPDHRHRAIAIIAQSIGGGGGVAGIPTETMSNTSFSGTVTLGGAGGGDGATVSASAINGSAISTSGSLAHAIVAQSIGGGGGIATMRGGLLVLGGSSGGSGGNVTVTTSSSVKTSGAAAIGIIAQSIGGGGGDGVGLPPRRSILRAPRGMAAVSR